MEITATVLVAVVYICSVGATPDLSHCDATHRIRVLRGDICSTPSDCLIKAQELYARSAYAEMAKNDPSIQPKFGAERRVGGEP